MTKKITLTALAVSAALLSINAHSAGFQVNEHSASGLGRAFSGEVAVADNASVIARNPAAMTRFDRMELSGSLSLIEPNVDVETVGSSPAQKYNDVAPFAAVPAGYFVMPINDKWAWGIGMFSNYGFATDYPKDANFGSLAGKTELLTVNVNPSIAYQINEQWSVGAGISLVYADAELNRHFGSIAPIYETTADQTLLNLNGDTWEFGWNIGVLWELNESNRFGLSYRAQVDLDFDGKFTDYQGNGVAGAKPTDPITVDGKLSVPLPAIAEFGAFHQLNSKWAVHYGVQWTQWSKFTELKATSSDCRDGVCLEKNEDFDDNFRYSIGATYNLNPDWIIRAGFAFDEQAGEATLSIPDTDRYWYSAGFTYIHSSALSIDVGMTYLYGKSSNFTEVYDVDGREYEFSSSNDAWLGAAQINYRF